MVNPNDYSINFPLFEYEVEMSGFNDYSKYLILELLIHSRNVYSKLISDKYNKKLNSENKDLIKNKNVEKLT